VPWTNPLTWAVGQLVTAAQMNIHVRDNMLEACAAKVTAVGDITYATAANALTRLAIGAANKRLGVSSGLPAWVDACDTLGPQAATSNVTLSSSAQNITGAIVTLTPGKWLLICKFSISVAAGDGNSNFGCFLNAAGVTGTNTNINPGIGVSAAATIETTVMWLCTSAGGTAQLQMQKSGGSGSSVSTNNSSILAVRIGG
jgi:hypothetical protein